jgi:hypothetical protein
MKNIVGKFVPGVNPRRVTEQELTEIAECCARQGPDLETIEGHLQGAAVAAFDHYTTDSPGYQGTVYAVIWPGGPEIVSSFIRAEAGDLKIIEASDNPPEPAALETAGEISELVEGLEASGLNVHIIDEHTDFSKLPPLK